MRRLLYMFGLYASLHRYVMEYKRRSLITPPVIESIHLFPQRYPASIVEGDYDVSKPNVICDVELTNSSNCPIPWYSTLQLVSFSQLVN